jgi:predicted enzyme related to lactoylglutathione lyase
MARVVHFEIYTDDPQAVAPFYEKVFGWNIKKWEGTQEYWVATTGHDDEVGINGGLLRPRPGQRSGTLNTVAVEAIDPALEKIQEQRGGICVPKMAIPTIGWLAYAEGPAGNVFGILKPDAAAK